jgi:hypothetical protein
MGLTRDYATKIYEWLNGFAPTFREPVLSSLFNEENQRPSDYISYSADVGNFNSEFIQAVTIYSQSTSYNRVMDIADAIESEVGENGIKVSAEWGYITIRKGTPFYQDKPDEADDVRAGYVNLLIRVYQKNI